MSINLSSCTRENYILNCWYFVLSKTIAKTSVYGERERLFEGKLQFLFTKIPGSMDQCFRLDALWPYIVIFPQLGGWHWHCVFPISADEIQLSLRLLFIRGNRDFAVLAKLINLQEWKPWGFYFSFFFIFTFLEVY